MAGQSNKHSVKTKKKKKRFSGRKWFYGLFFTAVLGIVCAIVGYLLIILNGERILEEHGDKLEFGEASIIYDANGNEINKLYDYEEHREMAEFKEIPEQLINAVIATEDQRFRDHSGLDFWAIGRAVVKDIIARSAVEGGSTITQQLAKNVFLSADKTFFRKATEASIAVAMEQQMSKDEILTMYLNRIYFGKGIHGVKAASEYYFGKDLSELELWESATLAAMPKAPNRYNPVNNPEFSKERRAVVLRLMYDQGYISEQEMNEARAADYEAPVSQAEYKVGSYHGFVDFVIEEAVEVTGLSEEELRVGGYHIYTTLDPKAQDAMDKEFNDASNFEESIDENIVQGAMVIIDHRTGEIKALNGGREYEQRGWNRVDKPRQPGSVFKPIVSYGPALESGTFFPWTILDNNKKCFNDYCPRDRWGPTPVSMKQAMKDSRNLASVWLLDQVGISEGIAFAEKLGFTLEKEDRNLTIALGGLTKGASPLQMATTYSVMANDGKSVDPHTIRKIEGNKNNKKYTYTYEAPKAQQLMSPETAWYLTEMMQAVVEKGGSGQSAAFGRQLAGKTGTTQHGIPGYTGSGIRDAWFVGYTPEWTAAVWMGYDNTDKDHVLKKGSPQAAAFFAKVMRPAMEHVDKGSFKRPDNIKEQKPPAAVTGFQAAYVEQGVIVELSWDASEESNVSYEVYRREVGVTAYSLFTEAVLPKVTDMTVFPGKTYEYYVVAHDSASNLRSANSAAIAVEIPDGDLGIPEIPLDPDIANPDLGIGVPSDDGQLDGGQTDGNNDQSDDGTEVPDEEEGQSGTEMPSSPPIESPHPGTGQAEDSGAASTVPSVTPSTTPDAA
ncbi:PBP1A family penicillin-binding protein [Paenibacillus chungangensis]|uniref:PBP1A family penicillin-binding protein n=1 Tax=Paenibacillus chungangensis TaxID=696535 RepID=A0ABW3HN47_9BACL